MNTRKRDMWLLVLTILWCCMLVAVGMWFATMIWGLDDTECEQAFRVGERLTTLEQQNNSLTYDMWQAHEQNNNAGVDVATESIDQNRTEYAEMVKTYGDRKTACLN